MAIDPPYRFDPFQNLVNVSWGGPPTDTPTWALYMPDGWHYEGNTAHPNGTYGWYNAAVDYPRYGQPGGPQGTAPVFYSAAAAIAWVDALPDLVNGYSGLHYKPNIAVTSTLNPTSYDAAPLVADMYQFWSLTYAQSIGAAGPLQPPLDQRPAWAPWMVMYLWGPV